MARQRPGWDDYLMALAYLVSVRSPDPVTRHGAIIVDTDHRIIGLGYNGFPRHSRRPYPTSRPEKYHFIVHSELNAILNCSVNPRGCTMYVTGMPCSPCMAAIAQAGIARVVYGGIASAVVDESMQSDTELVASNQDIELVRHTGNVRVVISDLLAYLDERRAV